MAIFDWGHEALWRRCTVIFAALTAVTFAAGCLHFVLFYPFRHLLSCLLVLSIFCLGAFLLTKEKRLPGRLVLIACAAAALISAVLASSAKTEPETLSGRLPDSGRSFTVTKTDLKSNPNYDRITVNEVIVPYVLSRQYSASVPASGEPVTALIEIVPDDAGNPELYCDGICCMKYRSGEGWEPLR
ncbi:MAG: hypothetical protein IJ060_11480 [Oscillospiraceae bacterium]|nr:hypothetical protein [Oscillospiraceae bacterium]